MLSTSKARHQQVWHLVKRANRLRAGIRLEVVQHHLLYHQPPLRGRSCVLICLHVFGHPGPQSEHCCRQTAALGAATPTVTQLHTSEYHQRLSAKRPCAGVTGTAVANVSCCTGNLNYCKTLDYPFSYRGFLHPHWWRVRAFASLFPSSFSIWRSLSEDMMWSVRTEEQAWMCSTGAPGHCTALMCVNCNQHSEVLLPRIGVLSSSLQCSSVITVCRNCPPPAP
jgi:hypothetical protein